MVGQSQQSVPERANTAPYESEISRFNTRMPN